MAEFNRHTFPAGGGWIFRQPQFGPRWKNDMAMVGFDASVKFIIAARKQNNAISLKHNLSLDYNTVADELEKYTRLRLGIPEEPAPSFFQQSRLSVEKLVLAAAGDVKKMWIGAETVWDCTKEAPVDPQLAENRALVCAGNDDNSKCPQNGRGDLTRWFTMPLSEAIRKAEARLRDKNLSTTHDSRLGVCNACLCPLKLKVHCDIGIIKSKLTDEVRASLDGRCWILSEGT